jgi:hypothetical protein
MEAMSPSEATGLPPIQLVTVHSAIGSTWSREEIYDDDLPPDPALGQRSNDSTVTEG